MVRVLGWGAAFKTNQEEEQSPSLLHALIPRERWQLDTKGEGRLMRSIVEDTRGKSEI